MTKIIMALRPKEQQFQFTSCKSAHLCSCRWCPWQRSTRPWWQCGSSWNTAKKCHWNTKDWRRITEKCCWKTDKSQILRSLHDIADMDLDVPWFSRCCVRHISVAANEENDPRAKYSWHIFQPEELNVQLVKNKLEQKKETDWLLIANCYRCCLLIATEKY